MDEARHWLPFAPDSIDHVGKEQTRVLDQVAYRFAELQDTMGQKVLPAVLELAQEPISADATFAVKLNWLERIGALPSADEWKKLRAARNAIAHEYPDDPELRVFRGGAAPTSGRGGMWERLRRDRSRPLQVMPRFGSM
ncbi:hypothetical protein [Methylococcus sp. Mc7]|uniref:hypothetical protein n=1 Tax=Methylococcus sp. Mc7 TaxID=2860258 RepID=UPI001C52EDE8|nr:hypothetical protein [Methylococcus sp. Mc7]QXP83606.1 hypothetical protein KW115_15800 [Methylococcus sp. Mc7]